VRRYRAGVLADALALETAWRYFDGTFMPESAKFDAHLAEYERYAAGGRPGRHRQVGRQMEPSNEGYKIIER
jgi:hypothetical protein